MRYLSLSGIGAERQDQISRLWFIGCSSLIDGRVALDLAERAGKAGKAGKAARCNKLR